MTWIREDSAKIYQQTGVLVSYSTIRQAALLETVDLELAVY